MSEAANDNRLGLHFSALKLAAREAVEKAEDYARSVRELHTAEDGPRARALIETADSALADARTALASILAAEQIVLSEAPEIVL